MNSSSAVADISSQSSNGTPPNRIWYLATSGGRRVFLAHNAV